MTNILRINSNCVVIDNKVISYDTHVATVIPATSTIIELGRWSSTTSRHVKAIADELNYTIVRADNWKDYSKEMKS